MQKTGHLNTRQFNFLTYGVKPSWFTTAQQVPTPSLRLEIYLTFNCFFISWLLLGLIPIYTVIHFILIHGYISFIFHHWNAITLLITRIIGIQDCLHVTHYFIILLNGVVYLDRLLGARHCISRPATGCLSYTHILSR